MVAGNIVKVEGEGGKGQRIEKSTRRISHKHHNQSITPERRVEQEKQERGKKWR